MAGEVSGAIDLASAVVLARHSRRASTVAADDVTRAARGARDRIGASTRAVDHARGRVALAAGIGAAGIARRRNRVACAVVARSVDVCRGRVDRRCRCVGRVEHAVVDREHRGARSDGERRAGHRDREDGLSHHHEDSRGYDAVVDSRPASAR